MHFQICYTCFRALMIIRFAFVLFSGKLPLERDVCRKNEKGGKLLYHKSLNVR